jgi:pilus assembly protein FimV
MSVMRRDGRQFLHITSIKALESEYVHLFLELADGTRRDIRGVTLWLTPDPQPAPPPKAAVAAPAPVAPPPASVEPLAAADPALPPAAPAKPSPLRAPAAACKPQYTADQIRTCAALDYKNGALTAQIVELEEKVRVLQLSLEGKKPSLAASASAPVEAAHAAPPPIKGPPKLAVPPVKPKPAVAPFPWLWIGIGVAVLLLAAGGGFWFWKRKKGTKGEAPAASKPGMLARLKARFSKKPKEEIVDARIEPAAE